MYIYISRCKECQLHTTLSIVIFTLRSCSAGDWLIIENNSAKESTQDTGDDYVPIIVHEQQHDNVGLTPLNCKNQTSYQMLKKTWISSTEA